MPGLIDFFVPPRTAWSQLADLLGPPGGAMPFALPASDFSWESLRPTLNPWDLPNLPLHQSASWLGLRRPPSFATDTIAPTTGAADTPPLGRSSFPISIGPGPDEVFAAYDRLKAATDANKTNAQAPANATATQPAWNIPPPDQRDLKPWVPTQAQTIEGRETGPSDSQGSLGLLRSATPSAPSWPDRSALTGPSFSDWLLPSAAKRPSAEMTPFGLPPESNPAWPPQASPEQASAFPPVQDFGDEIQPYRTLHPFHRPRVSPDVQSTESINWRALRGGLNSAIRRSGQLKGAITRDAALDPEAEPDLPEAKNIEWSDFADPLNKLMPKMLYGLAESSPTIAGGVVGGAGLGGLGFAVGGPPGATVGAIGGGALGSGAVSAAMSLGPYYQQALRETGDPELAFSKAFKSAALDGVITGATVAAFSYAPFSSFVKNLLLQGVAVQPGLSVAGTAVKNAATDRLGTEDLMAGIPSAVASTFLPLPGFHGTPKPAGVRPRARPSSSESSKAQLELFDPSETGERGQVHPPKLPQYRGGPALGSFHSPSLNMMMRSGYEGPASSMKGVHGFDIVTRGHLEGHAAALMRQRGIREATIYINNPTICPSCMQLLPRMLPSGSSLNVILPNGEMVTFRGVAP